ncbi:hypothetical protein RFI_02006 [Reticulomyxa filosa]|uniref:Uncharacterized protein n=1 Tax=Reticulomyxa filosa TaxID=46433 RepID=X6P957_RETFI|nr:hypothetical protein RFI_02006 [Reticulomyxa filosa]|eukprot:ETO35065.1 hypothetical protein RFI_02006 [Reticulomyxa filosa]
MPSFPVLNELKTCGLFECESGEYNSVPSLYCKGREISEEYRYVLERAGANKYIGNNLQKPSLLVRPFSDRTTTTQAQEARAGGVIEHKQYKQRRQMTKSYLSFSSHPSATSDGSWPVLEFLANCSASTYFNLQCKQDDVNTKRCYVELNRALLHQQHRVLTVVAMNNKYFSVYTHVLGDATARRDVKYRDVRLYPGLNPHKHFVEQRQIDVLLTAKDKVVVEDFKTSQAEVFESIEHLFSSYRSLTRNDKLNEWTFLFQWNTLSQTDKLNILNKFFSHEFNLFIYCKERQFFDAFVKPLIEMKVHKQVIDYWLLGDSSNLRPYLDMGVFMQLNALEKILLCFAFKHEFKHKFRKYFADKHESIKFDPYQFKTLFEFALAERNFADTQTLPPEQPISLSSSSSAAFLLLQGLLIPTRLAISSALARSLHGTSMLSGQCTSLLDSF